jgi:excisionase family DNA binding protein
MASDRLLTVEEVADYLNVHRDTVYAMVRSGRLRGFQLGGRKAGWRISETDLRHFVEQRIAASYPPSSGATDGLDEQQQREREAFEARQRREMDNFMESQRRARDGHDGAASDQDGASSSGTLPSKRRLSSADA